MLVARRRVRPPGAFALYVAGYAGFRIFEEQLRVDPSHHLLGMRLNFFVATAVCLAGLAWFVSTQRGRRWTRWTGRGAVLLVVGGSACALSACGERERPQPRPVAAVQASATAPAVMPSVLRTIGTTDDQTRR
jgi:hypothetical protein